LKTTEPLQDVLLTDLLGNVVMNLGEVNSGLKSLDVSALPSGMYFLTAKVDNKSLTKRFVKQ
jgi:hypothetical protein